MTAAAAPEGRAPLRKHAIAGRAGKRKHQPRVVMYLSLLMIWVSVWRIHTLWPILGKLQVSIIVEVLLALVLVVSTATGSGARPAQRKPFAFIAPFILLAIMVMGLPFGLYPGKSLTFITKDFGPTLILMAAVATSLPSMEDVEWLTFAHLVGATVYCAWVYFMIPIGAEGRLGNLIFYDANDFALVVACSIPFAVYFARPGVGVAKRMFSLFAILLFVCMIIKSGSRGGFLGLIGVAVFTLIAFRAIPLRIRFGALVGGVMFFLAFASPTYWTMMRTLLHPANDPNMTDPTGRKAIWKRGIGYMVAHPVLGVGAANFPEAEGTISEISRVYASQGAGLKWSTAHNSFVLVGAELGVSGMTVFVLMFARSLAQLRRIRQSREFPGTTATEVAFAQALMASLLAFCISGFFVSAAYFPYLYVTIGLVAAHIAGVQARAGDSAKFRSADLPRLRRARSVDCRGLYTRAWYPSEACPLVHRSDRRVLLPP